MRSCQNREPKLHRANSFPPQREAFFPGLPAIVHRAKLSDRLEVAGLMQQSLSGFPAI